MGVSRSAIESRFGVRLLLVFAACAVVPVMAFSAMAYLSTRAQLENDAEASLASEAKSATMGIVERIEIGAAYLGFVEVTGRLDGPESKRIFEKVERAHLSAVELSVPQRARLESGGTVLVSTGSTGLRKLRLLRLDQESLLVGTFSADFLFLAGRPGAGERYWVSDASGELLFIEQAAGVDSLSAERFSSSEVRNPYVVDGPNGNEIAIRWPLFLNFAYVYPELIVGMSRDVKTVHRPLNEFKEGFAVAFVLALLGSAAIAFWQIRVRTGPLDALIETTRAIKAGDFSARANIKSNDEFDLLGSSINSMVENIERNFSTMTQLRTLASRLLRAERLSDVSRIIVPTAIDLVAAEGGTFLCCDGGSEGLPVGFTPISDDPAPLIGADLPRGELLRQAVRRGSPLVAQRGEAADESVWTALDDWYRTRVEACVVLPFDLGSKRSTMALELIFESSPDSATLNENVTSSLALLSSQTEAALATVALIEDLRGLFEGVVELTVEAIDRKSPYTGDHCRRVPILTEMIAEAACSAEGGPLKEFSLSDAERYELKIAALLHDCGKVATPIHVMDKATKLEKIYDRIELVRLRAEIISRDLEAQAMRAFISEHGLSPSGDEVGHTNQNQIEDDFAFLGKCNIGGEFMDEPDKVRVDEIGERYRWTDRFGRIHKLLTEDEQENLKIGRGTLNSDERGIINEHVTTTIQLLEKLPFPEGMQNVPAIAGSHHEHVDGTGYPLGLAQEELCLQGRILGLADVYEALTAIDRPYKKGNTLSETLDILDRLVDSGKLDRDLHEIFVSQKIYLRYAVEHMQPHQIDDVHRNDLEEMTAAWSHPNLS